jgi:hypothetical protein
MPQCTPPSTTIKKRESEREKERWEEDEGE